MAMELSHNLRMHDVYKIRVEIILLLPTSNYFCRILAVENAAFADIAPVVRSINLSTATSSATTERAAEPHRRVSPQLEDITSQTGEHCNFSVIEEFAAQSRNNMTALHTSRMPCACTPYLQQPRAVRYSYWTCKLRAYHPTNSTNHILLEYNTNPCLV